MLNRLRGMPRGVEFGSLHETLLITGVATILFIRTQLWLTNYPQLGGRGLHIAHLLWGGLFMLIAIGLLLTFLGRPVRRLAAIVGGIGFGFFIDELGKFITSDNNYFYKPAAALIYLIFIGLFMLSRALQRRERIGPRDELANAVDLLGDAARGDLDGPGRSEALARLDRADQADPLVAPLRAVFEGLAVRSPVGPGAVASATSAVRARAARLSAWPRFGTFVSALFGVWALLSVLGVFELVFSVGIELGTAHRGYRSDQLGNLSFVNVASLVSTTVSGLLVVRGIFALRRGHHAHAYRSFEQALLVAIFVTQVFSFVESQFGAVFGLAVDLVLLVALRTLVARELPTGAADERTEPLPVGTVQAPVST